MALIRHMKHEHGVKVEMYKSYIRGHLIGYWTLCVCVILMRRSFRKYSQPAGQITQMKREGRETVKAGDIVFYYGAHKKYYNHKCTVIAVHQQFIRIRPEDTNVIIFATESDLQAAVHQMKFDEVNA